ncbi:MAG: alpha-1,2-fucosyltransferase [Lewinellaceae bacterium]|nr:alpha-1,2-fucosyltransferase [Lewinellaceae bacterium]
MAKIIARVLGGLGNQLFIYASAKALAIRTGSELVLDTRSGFLRDDYQRQFALKHFEVHYREANAFERFDFPMGRGLRHFFRLINHRLPFTRRFYLSDLLLDNKVFIPAMLRYQPWPRTWMEGYWQSARYFKDIRKTLLREITVKSPLSQETEILGNRIRSSNSVCVHLRMLRHFLKGVEMMNEKKTEAEHYIKSMEYIAQRVDNPLFVCFSDAPQSVKSELSSLPFNIIFVTHNKGDERAHEDFYLMTLCRHYILSNSTFGWWPAWLCQHPESIVLTPPINQWDNSNILPSKWIISENVFHTQKNTI